MRHTVLALALLACTASVDDATDDTGAAEATGDSGPLPHPELDPAACAGPTPALHGFDPTWRPPGTADALGWAIAPLVPLLEADATVAAALRADDDVAARVAAVEAAIDAAAMCSSAGACVAGSLALDDLDVAGMAADIADAVDAAGLADRHLTPSGMWVHLRDETAHDQLVAAVTEAAEVVVGTLKGRVLPLPPEKLGPSVGATADRPTAASPLAPLLALATTGLRADARDEAVRYGLWAETENAAALARLRDADLDAYRFSVILVPGQGPGDLETPLHEVSALRADRAAELWKDGVAPVVLTSGGHVHPDRTSFSEAVEMRRYLVDTHGLPADAVLVDPYARHTTTNLRNASRILLRAGVPPTKPFVVSTDVGQSGYIAVVVGGRSEDELGYVPWTALARTGGTESCVLVTADALRVDGHDALDP